MEPSMIFYLAIVTLSAGVVFGVWQMRRARKAKEEGETTYLD